MTATDVYTVHPLDSLLTDVLLPRMGAAALRGVVWYPTRPPIEEIEFEMDLRGVRTELVCPV